jgi:hypothetical protein
MASMAGVVGRLRKGINMTVNHKIGRVVVAGLAACVAVVLIAACAQSGSAVAHSAAIDGYPLSQHLPSKSFVKLGGGKIGDGKWGAFVYRRNGSETICVQELGATPGAGQSVSVLEGPASCRPHPDEGFQRTITAIRMGSKSLRVLTLAFGAAAKRVELVGPTGRVDRLATEPLSAQEAATLGTNNFVFAIAVERPPNCHSKLRTLRGDGSLIGGTSLAPC